MVEYYNNTLCIESAWLFGESGMMSAAGYKHLVSRKQVTVVRRGCMNTPALVSYDSLPERYKRMIVATYGDPRNKLMRNVLLQHIQTNNEAVKYYSEYKLPDQRNLPSKVQLEYYTNAILLEACTRLMADRKSFVRSRGGKTNRIYEELVQLISDLTSGDYPHSLPANPRRLEDKIKRYREEGFESLIHRNFCNRSAAKVNDDIKESIMIELLADPRNLDNEQIRAMYNIMAERMEWKKISGSTVATWRDTYDLQTRPGRRGATEFMNSKTMQVKRMKPTAPLYYWTLDGWDVELLYQDTRVDKKTGRRTTTYSNRPTVVIVLDPCVNYPIGYAVGTHETPDLIRLALRNAVDHTAELFGGSYMAHQIQSDHYAIKALTPIYTDLSKHYTPARVKNSKAKVIEPYFNTINKKYCQLMPNWSGVGVTSRKESQPNVDFLNKYRNNFPAWAGVVEQIEKLIALERKSKIERYMHLWISAPKEHKIELSRETYLYWCGNETGQTNMLEGSGLKPTILGLKREYDCFDLTFRNHYSTRWTVKFDPNDLSTVLCVNEDGTLRYMLEQKYIQPMALMDRKPGDSVQLQKVRDYNTELIQAITDKRQETGDTVRAFFEENPALNDTLTKMILIDSHGQHKDRRNDQRAISAGEEKPRRIKAAAIEDEEDDLNIYKML